MAISFLTQAQRDSIVELYIAYFNRAPEAAGLNSWSSVMMADMNAGKTATEALKGIANQFYAAGVQYNIYSSAQTVESFITTAYANALGRTSVDAAGMTYWTAKLVSGDVSRGEFVQTLIKDAKAFAGDATWGWVSTYMANRVAVGNAFADNSAGLTGAAAIAAGSTALSGVTAALAQAGQTAAQAVAAFNTPAAVTGQTFTLTTGIDSGALFTGGAGNDTFSGSTSAGALTLTSLDAIDGGAGNDTLSIAATVLVDTTAMVGTTVKNIETVTITSTGAVTANTTAWTGVTNLTTASTGNSTLTAAVTTDITATVAAPTGAGAAVINGGKVVTLSVTDTAAADTATSNAVTVGVTTASAGAVTITQSETHAASANAGASALATGTIRVDGGTTVAVNSLASGGAGDNAGDVLTIGQVTVNGKGTATSVSVTQSAATLAYATAGDLYKVTNGVVAITDNNTATKSDTITSVTLANFGNSTIVGNALTTLNLTGGGAAATASGTVGISQSASVITAVPTTLAINMASGRVGVIADANDQYTTLNVASAAAATIAGLDFTNATTLNVSGAGVTTISAQTDLAKVTAITSTGGGLALTGTLAVGTTFTGAAGKESVDVGATTKAITTGAGDDTITISATALGTGGSVDAGEGVDTLSMTAANAVTASSATTFETTISGFEKLSLAAVAATGTVNLANIDDLNDVAVAAVNAGQALTLSGASSGINLRFADGTQTSTIVTLANNGSADVANVFLTTVDELSTHAAIDLTGFETLNIASADTDTNTVAASNAITTLTAGDATTVVVTGNAGLNLGTFTGTKVTSFNASAVTAGAVLYTTGALAAAATITGGAGADTLSGAAAAIAGVTINGGAGNDIITGSATKASTLNGDAGNDTITGGAAADVIDGGTGTNTYVFSSANVVEQAGSSTTTGVVINLSDTALTQSGVFAATGAYLTTTAPTVAAGTSTYLFNGESSTNASVVDTLANINNATGTNLADYIVGSAAANVITGGTGVDKLTGGAGADTFVTTVGAAYTTATADTITDFTAGASGDILQIDISDSTAIADLGIVAAGNGSTAIAGNLVIRTMTAGTGITLNATDEIVTISGTLADAAALIASIGTGAGIITKSAANTTTNGLLVTWTDGTNTYVSTVADAGTDAAMTSADLTVVTLVTLTGVLTGFDTVNFTAVA